jgi:hypothetical protein
MQMQGDGNSRLRVYNENGWSPRLQSVITADDKESIWNSMSLAKS